MVHGILQFTPRIAFRYVLHRCESRDIRCRESSLFFLSLGARRGRGADRRCLSILVFLGDIPRRVPARSHRARRALGPGPAGPGERNPPGSIV